MESASVLPSQGNGHRATEITRLPAPNIGMQNKGNIVTVNILKKGGILEDRGFVLAVSSNQHGRVTENFIQLILIVYEHIASTRSHKYLHPANPRGIGIHHLFVIVIADPHKE